MDHANYAEAAERVKRQDASSWRVDRAGCASLVNRLRTLAGGARLAA